MKKIVIEFNETTPNEDELSIKADGFTSKIETIGLLELAKQSIIEDIGKK